MSDEKTQTRPTILTVDGQKIKKRKHGSNHFVKHVNENGYSLPLELRPVVDAITAYGRKMNAMGKMGAVQILDKIASELRRTGLDKTNNSVRELIVQTERMSENLKLELETAYDERERFTNEKS